jgi:hypothetical protein
MVNAGHITDNHYVSLKFAETDVFGGFAWLQVGYREDPKRSRCTNRKKGWERGQDSKNMAHKAPLDERAASLLAAGEERLHHMARRRSKRVRSAPDRKGTSRFLN